jgi:hypothetical protein
MNVGASTSLNLYIASKHESSTRSAVGEPELDAGIRTTTTIYFTVGGV